MFNQLERELKILVSKEDYEKIINSYDFSEPWIQTNTYYDTENEQVRGKGGAMRIRTIGDRKIFTLKIRLDPITLKELEKDINCSTIEEIDDEEVLSWIASLNLTEPLRVKVCTKTKRCDYFFENGELCADETEFKNHTDYELEYEYTSDHDGITVFNDILKPLNLHYEKNCSSKLSRAMEDLNLIK